MKSWSRKQNKPTENGNKNNTTLIATKCIIFSGFLFSAEEIFHHSMSRPSTLTRSPRLGFLASPSPSHSHRVALPPLPAKGSRDPGDGLTPAGLALHLWLGTGRMLRGTAKFGAGTGEGTSPVMPVPSRYIIPGEKRQHRQSVPTDAESRSSIACTGWVFESEIESMYIHIWLHPCVWFVRFQCLLRV